MAKTKRKPRERKAKQGHLEGMEPPSIPAIDQAAEAYKEARDDRMSALETEMELQAALLALMHENRLTTYTYDDKVVNVTELEKVAVRKKPKEKGSEE